MLETLKSEDLGSFRQGVYLVQAICNESVNTKN